MTKIMQDVSYIKLPRLCQAPIHIEFKSSNDEDYAGHLIYKVPQAIAISIRIWSLLHHRTPYSKKISADCGDKHPEEGKKTLKISGKRSVQEKRSIGPWRRSHLLKISIGPFTFDEHLIQNGSGKQTNYNKRNKFSSAFKDILYH